MADSSPRIRIRKNPIKKKKSVAGEVQELKTFSETHADLESANIRVQLAKARKETALAEMSEMENAIAKNQLIVRADADKIVFEAGKFLLDSILEACEKLGPDLANEKDPLKISKILKTRYTAILKNFVDEWKTNIEQV